MDRYRKILIAPDKFKGCLSAREVGEAIALNFPLCKTAVKPMADGGDGSLEVLHSNCGGIITLVDAVDSFMNPVKAPLLLDGKGGCFIEMATVCSLASIPYSRRNPERTTTFGLGLLIKEALHLGCREIFVGIGGSSTNDGGEGMLRALAGTPQGADLKEVVPLAIKAVDGAHLHSVADVASVLLGPGGATMTFAAQKGADGMMLERLEARMKEYADTLENILLSIGSNRHDFRQAAGSGAAGGTGAALHILGADRISGCGFFADTSNIRAEAEDADLVITGEGCLDRQSFNGKVTGGIAEICRQMGRKLWVVCGHNCCPPKILFENGISRIFEINEKDPARALSKLSSLNV